MKKDIIRCDLSGRYKENGKWWKWNEYCDKCGSIIMDDEFLHSREPNINEEDYCTICLRKMLEERACNAN